MNMNSLAFKSKIKFVDNSTFNKLPDMDCWKKGTCIDDRHWVDQTKTADKGITYDIENCTAGGLTNSEQVSIFHIQPRSHNFEWFEQLSNQNSYPFEVCMKCQSGLTDENSNNFNGLLIGGKYDLKEGQDFDSDAGDAPSRKMFQKIKKFFDKNKISHSIIWGQEKGNFMKTSIYYTAKDDTWFVHVKEKDNVENKIKSLKDLISSYKLISISPKDQLYIKGEEIPREQLKKLNIAG